MRRTLLLATALCVAASCFRNPIAACGDKFLVLGRSARFDRVYAAIHPAAILLYGRSVNMSGVLDRKFQASLTRAGHTINVVEDETLLEDALRTRPFDFVLTDPKEVSHVQVRSEQSPSRPVVLPVLYKATKTETEMAKAQFHVALIASDRPGRYLSIIDAEMQERIKSHAARK